MLLPKGTKGFTLTEVIIVIAIIGLVSVIAVPSINSFLPGYRLRAATRDMVSFLREARLQAVKQGRSCQIGRNIIINGETCDFVAYIDLPGGTPATYDDGEEVLSYRFSTYPGVGLDTNQGEGDGLDFDEDQFRFNSRGLLPVAGVIHLINDKKTERRISFTLAGAVRVEQ